MDLDPKSHGDLPAANNKELKNLLSKGGRGGDKDAKHADWNYFPKKREKRTKSMITVSEWEQDIMQMTWQAEQQEDNETPNSTYLLLHVNQIEQVLNHQCKICNNNSEKKVTNKKWDFRHTVCPRQST